MKLENQVVRLELAKKLKELGVKQESYFYWEKSPFAYDKKFVIRDNNFCLNPIKVRDPKDQNKYPRYSAFTVAELGEMLPNQSLEMSVKCYKGNNVYWAEYWKYDRQIYLVGGEDNEADARAKMLIYLIGNNLITVT